MKHGFSNLYFKKIDFLYFLRFFRQTAKQLCDQQTEVRFFTGKRTY